jgi:polyferredoxin
MTLLSLYVYGLLALFGLTLGRAICGFLCPFGLIQELLYKIPLKKIRNSKLFPILQRIKYVVLFVLVIGIPTMLTVTGQVSVPVFCKFVCPAGTLEAGVPLIIANSRIGSNLGFLFVWKLTLLLLVIFFAIVIYRPFCRFFCPLGAIYSFFNKFSLLNIREDVSKCTNCSECKNVCLLNLPSPKDRECIRCGRCVSGCKHGGKKWTFGYKQKNGLESGVKSVVYEALHTTVTSKS